jgi:hypothetical protein
VPVLAVFVDGDPAVAGQAEPGRRPSQHLGGVAEGGELTDVQRIAFQAAKSLDRTREMLRRDAMSEEQLAELRRIEAERARERRRR